MGLEQWSDVRNPDREDVGPLSRVAREDDEARPVDRVHVHVVGDARLQPVDGRGPGRLRRLDLLVEDAVADERPVRAQGRVGRDLDQLRLDAERERPPCRGMVLDRTNRDELRRRGRVVARATTVVDGDLRTGGCGFLSVTWPIPAKLIATGDVYRVTFAVVDELGRRSRTMSSESRWGS
jgi:hypothetical protein